MRNVMTLDGSMTQNKRTKIIQAFQDKNEEAVLIVSYVASAGLNLQSADILIIMVRTPSVFSRLALTILLCRIRRGLHKTRSSSSVASGVTGRPRAAQCIVSARAARLTPSFTRSRDRRKLRLRHLQETI